MNLFIIFTICFSLFCYILYRLKKIQEEVETTKNIMIELYKLHMEVYVEGMEKKNE